MEAQTVNGLIRYDDNLCMMYIHKFRCKYIPNDIGLIFFMVPPLLFITSPPHTLDLNIYATGFSIIIIHLLLLTA